MSEFDSIKRFINCCLLLIISCFLIFSFTELMYMLKTKIILLECFFHIFIIYFLIDLSIAINNESGMYFPEYYYKSKFVVTRIIRKINS